jgi:histidine triad (HIT) family protein
VDQTAGMPTLFTRIIAGELPGRFVWRDDRCVVFTSINPLRPGHALVVPRAEVDHWLDLDVGLVTHLMTVCHAVGQAQMAAFEPVRVGLIIAGLEVPHCHIHVVPIDSEANLSFANAEHQPDPAALDDAARRLREALVDQGHPEAVGTT